MAADIKSIIQKNKYLTSQNGNWLGYFQDVADFCLPRKAWINSIKAKGETLKFNFLYDSTAIRASQKMVSGFHSNLTNQATKWFGFTLYDQNKMSKNLETWFKRVVEIQLSIMSQTNLYNVLKEFYLDYGVFGTGAISTLPHEKKKVNYMSIPIQQILVEEDDEERVIAVYNNFRLNAAQAYGKWGNKCGDQILKAYEGDKPEPFEFLHYVGPRGDRNPDKIDNLNMPFESVWISKKDNHKLDESGFKRFPHQVGRFWKDNTDVFGFSPAMNVLADIKLLNACVRTWLRRAMKEADPPLQAPSRGYVLPLNLNPAQMNYRDPGTLPEALQAIGVAAGDFSITEKFLEYIERNINEGFFVDVFQSFNLLSKQMTVPEVQKRISEGMVLLGPVVNQCQYEVLTPLVLNTFFILLEKGMFGKVPEELYENEFGPVYESPLSRAARESEMMNLDGFMSRTGQIAAVLPAVLDKINPDKTIEFIAKTMSVDPQIFRDEKEVQEIRAQRMQMQQAQMGMEQAHTGAKIAKEGATAEKHLAHAKSLAAA